MPRLPATRALKGVARKLIPRPAWHWLAREVKDLPFRLRDLGPDLRERFSGARLPLPPARLRRRVGLTSSRDEFLTVGREVAATVLRAYQEHRRPEESYRRWLDFGCGSGRLARFLVESGERELHGVDVDRAAIRWARRRFGPGFMATGALPPLPFPDAAFDVACAISVFTHLDEPMQLAWLQELHRVLRPRGLLIATTHHEDLVWTRPDLSPEQRARLAADGFLFASGEGSFNDDSAFHTLPYLERTWGRRFALRTYAKLGLCGYQDLAVWEAEPRGAASAPSPGAF
jgi:SAM-dependent methyltransferase